MVTWFMIAAHQPRPAIPLPSPLRNLYVLCASALSFRFSLYSSPLRALSLEGSELEASPTTRGFPVPCGRLVRLPRSSRSSNSFRMIFFADPCPLTPMESYSSQKHRGWGPRSAAAFAPLTCSACMQELPQLHCFLIVSHSFVHGGGVGYPRASSPSLRALSPSGLCALCVEIPSCPHPDLAARCAGRYPSVRSHRPSSKHGQRPSGHGRTILGWHRAIAGLGRGRTHLYPSPDRRQRRIVMQHNRRATGNNAKLLPHHREIDLHRFVFPLRILFLQHVQSHGLVADLECLLQLPIVVDRAARIENRAQRV